MSDSLIRSVVVADLQPMYMGTHHKLPALTAAIWALIETLSDTEHVARLRQKYDVAASPSLEAK